VSCCSAILQPVYTGSLTLSEEHRLRVFENRLLRRIFGPKRDEVTGEWRRLHNEELHDLYCSPKFLSLTNLGSNPRKPSKQSC
jgi:hypothetical protein